MLERVDRIQIAVHDRAAAERDFAALLGAAHERVTESAHLNAWRTVLALGESEIELCEPRGPGIVRDFLDAHGEGLLAAGYATADVGALATHLGSVGAEFVRDGEQLSIPGRSTAGFPMVISKRATRPRVGPVSFLYEATNALDSDWRAAAERYTKLFRLDPARFSPISSKRFGYEGTLLLFDPAKRLDRIELSQTFADRPGPMRRFVERRGGDCLYMCYVETHDLEGLKKRLLENNAQLTPRGADLAAERDGFWVHPKNLHGVLLGVSRTSLGWEWSGQPQRVRAL